MGSRIVFSKSTVSLKQVSWNNETTLCATIDSWSQSGCAQFLPGGHEGVLVSVGEHCFVILVESFRKYRDPKSLVRDGIHEIAASFQAEPVHETEQGCGAITVLPGGNVLQGRNRLAQIRHIA